MNDSVRVVGYGRWGRGQTKGDVIVVPKALAGKQSQLVLRSEGGQRRAWQRRGLLVVWRIRTVVALLGDQDGRTQDGHGVCLGGGDGMVGDEDLIEVVVVAVFQAAGRGRGLDDLVVRLHRLLRTGRQRSYHGDGLREGDALAALAQRAFGPRHEDFRAVVGQGLVAVLNFRTRRLMHVPVVPRVAEGQVTVVGGVCQQRVPRPRQGPGSTKNYLSVPAVVLPKVVAVDAVVQGGDGGCGDHASGVDVVVVLLVVGLVLVLMVVGLRRGQSDEAVGAGVVRGDVAVGQAGHLEWRAVDGAVVVVVVVVAAVGGEVGGLVRHGRVQDDGLGLLFGLLNPGYKVGWRKVKVQLSFFHIFISSSLAP